MLNRTTTRRGRKRGYTLVEVLITVTIMGLAAAIVVPSMQQGGTLGVQAGARIIIADLLFAQNEAMAQQGQRRVVFDTANDSYRVEKFDNTSSTWVLEHNPVLGGTADEQNYIVDFAEDGRFRGVDIVSASFNGTNTVSFDDLGNPSSGGTVLLRYEAHRYEVTVAPFTGRVTVEKLTD